MVMIALTEEQTRRIQPQQNLGLLEELKGGRTRKVSLNNQPCPCVSKVEMKTLFLSLLAITAIVGSSLPARADDDRRDHDWNDEYWHGHHDGYWQGHKGHWETHHHKHTFIQAGPVTIEQH
jgi:hypothetical protein